MQQTAMQICKAADRHSAIMHCTQVGTQNSGHRV